MRLLITSVITALVAYGATANESGTTDTQTSKSSTVSSVRLSKLMDANIQSSSGEDLGQLEDVLIDSKTGDIKFAVLGRGGVLGVGEKYVPVPWRAIQVQSEKQFTLNVDKNKLKTAPTTDKEYSRLQDPGYTVTIYRFFAVPADTGMGGSDLSEGSHRGAGSSTNQPSSDTKAGDPANAADQQ